MQETSLDETIIPWRGRLSFKTYNPAKIIKYGILVRMVCESKTGYICNFEIYSGKGRKLEETILSILEPYKNMWYHLYQDNSVEITKKLFENKIRICGTLRSNRESLRDTKLAANHTVFVRDNYIIIQLWNNGKRTINMISTIHSANMINSGKICRKSKKIIHKPCAVNT
jgi:hypothetical protein